MGSSEYGILGTTGMIGAHLNPAAGAALGNKVLDNGRVTVAFFGDGATQRAEFHSALNFATVQELPVVFIIENNHWTEATPVDKVIAVEDLADLASHGLPTEVIDGQDVEKVVEATAAAAERARNDDGPTLIEAKTYRYRPHAETMPEHRDEATLEEWRDRDPIELYRSRVLEDGLVTEDEIEEIDRRLQRQIDEAFEAAENDELPDEEAMYHVYKDTDIDHWKGVVR